MAKWFLIIIILIILPLAVSPMATRAEFVLGRVQTPTSIPVLFQSFGNYGIMEWLGLERALRIIQFLPPLPIKFQFLSHKIPNKT